MKYHHHITLKAEATVKSMKRLVSLGRCVDWDSLFVAPYCSIATQPATRWFFPSLLGHPVQYHLPAHRSSSAREWQKASEKSDKTRESSQKQAEWAYNEHAMEELQIGNQVVVQHPRSTLWEIYGTITTVGLYRRYFVKTHSGCVLIRDRRFIRKRSPYIAAPKGVTVQTPALP